MSLFTISDPHLFMACPEKSMDVFGGRWQNAADKMKKQWEAVVSPDDTVVMPGDISWALSLSDTADDFRFLSSLPGKKIISKGNHDFWWNTVSKNNRFLATIGVPDVTFLHNNALYAEGFIIAGTRGWYLDPSYDKMPLNADYEKIRNREAERLRTSLRAAVALKNEHPDAEILVFFHFPPIWNGITVEPFPSILHEYGIRRVYFGHIHGNYLCEPSFTVDGITYSLISADYLNFCPRRILPDFP